MSSTFRAADLRKSVLGGVENGKRNAFRSVDFTKADLRETVYVSADMVGCTFVASRLDKVDFQGTVFDHCTFAGELREVLFYHHAFRGEAFPPNEMRDVDFRNAKFRLVEFRGLDMRHVAWPNDEDHIILDNYKARLDEKVKLLESRSDTASRQLAAILKMKRKWAGANQQQGVLSKTELAEVAGEEKVAELFHRLGGG